MRDLRRIYTFGKIERFARAPLIRSLDFAPSEGSAQPHARKIFPSAWRIAVARVMFLRECDSRQFERNPLRRSILSCHISSERREKRTFTSQFIPQIWVSPGHFWAVRYRYWDQRWPTLGHGRYSGISAEYLNDEDASCNMHVQGESDTYLPTYVRSICESNGIGYHPAGLFAGRWTWLFCGLGRTAIYI